VTRSRRARTRTDFYALNEGTTTLPSKRVRLRQAEDRVGRKSWAAESHEAKLCDGDRRTLTT
jgi:hypothetical protein